MSKKLLFILPVILVVAFFLGTRFTAPTLDNTVLAAGSKEKFEYLAGQTSNSCGLVSASLVTSFSEDDRIQGSCCSAMDLHRYQEQVEGLKEYSKFSQVPEDPYDIPVTLAKQLLEYKDSIVLNVEQQKIYDEAMELSHEGGPCCCRCWRWDAFEGLAKYLITEEDFSSEQIAELWDLLDGCGGTDHAHS